MVRLKVSEKKKMHPFSQQFQFHYGTIKRLFQRQMLRITATFQFHYGTIKRNLFKFKTVLLYSISIPLWYD